MAEYIIDMGNSSYQSTSGLLCADVSQLRDEVVRCRDCKDYRASDQTCHAWQWNNWEAAIEVEPNGFCAWGERTPND